MGRILPAIVVALFLAQASGLIPLAAAPSCREACPDDDAKGYCAPGCSDCTCCAHSTPVTTPPEAPARALPTDGPGAASAAPARETAEPREVEHIPKGRFA